MKKLVFFLVCIPCLTFSQIKVDTTFAGVVEENKKFNIRFIPDTLSSDRFICEKFTLDNVLVEKTFFLSEQKKVRAKNFENLKKKNAIRPDGLQTTFDNRTGVKTAESLFRKGLLRQKSKFYPDGSVSFVLNIKLDSLCVDEYYESGQLKRHEEYNKNREIILTKHYTPEGKDTVFNEVYWVAPKFPGGEEALAKYLRDNIKYPSYSFKKKIEGVVKVRFTVKQNGMVSDVWVEQSVCFDLDQEAVQVIKEMPKWIPALEYGEPIDMQYILPVQFRLS